MTLERGPAHDGLTGWRRHHTLPGCSCPWCDDQRTRRRASRAYGRKLAKLDDKRSSPEQHAAAVAVISKHYDAGLSLAQLSEKCGVVIAVLWDAMNRPGHIMSPQTYRCIMAVTDWSAPLPSGIRRSGRYVDSTAAVRMLLALTTLGFSYNFMAEELGYKGPQMLSYVVRKKPRITSELNGSIMELYARLSCKTGEDYGLLAQTCKRMRTMAKRNCIPGPACWDDDTIGDPKALPQWTGFCGTLKGYRLHVERGIAMCPACASKGPSDGS